MPFTMEEFGKLNNDALDAIRDEADNRIERAIERQTNAIVEAIKGSVPKQKYLCKEDMVWLMKLSEPAAARRKVEKPLSVRRWWNRMIDFVNIFK
jgi:hypothetical protein